MRLKESTLVHICYKNIYTRALQSRYYNDSQHYYKFANEWNEQWGKVIKWEANIPEVYTKRVRNKQHFTTSYQKKAKYELFLTNVSSKDELQGRLKSLLSWVTNNPV